MGRVEKFTKTLEDWRSTIFQWTESFSSQSSIPNKLLDALRVIKWFHARLNSNREPGIILSAYGDLGKIQMLAYVALCKYDRNIQILFLVSNPENLRMDPIVRSPGAARAIINVLAKNALAHYKQIILFSLNPSKGFYEKLGFGSGAAPYGMGDFGREAEYWLADDKLQAFLNRENDGEASLCPVLEDSLCLKSHWTQCAVAKTLEDLIQKVERADASRRCFNFLGAKKQLISSDP